MYADFWKVAVAADALTENVMVISNFTTDFSAA
jgi:hypothetical protein